MARRSPGTWPARSALAVTCIGLGYLVWKHGFIRADGHVLGFFYAALIAALLVPRALLLSLPLAAVAMAGVYQTIPALVKNSPGYAWLHLRDGTAMLLHPATRHEAFTQKTAAHRKEADLPLARSAIGNAGVDVFGHEQSIALLNQFNYRPRPVFQGYQTYSPALAELNASHFSSSAAPEFVLARMESIDERLPALDDARLLPLLLINYELVDEDHGFLILKQKPSRTAPITSSLGTVEARLKEPVPVPRSASPLWMHIEVRPSVWGRLRAFFYKPAAMRILLVLGSGETKVFRFNPAAADGGFLLTPFLPDTDALRTWLSTRSETSVQTVTLTPERRCTWFFQPDITVRFATLPVPAP